MSAHLSQKQITLEEIEIKRITPEIVHWFKNDGTFLGTINNEYEFNHIRIELLKNNLTEECYFMWNDMKLTVDTDGSMSDFPFGLYDMNSRQLAEIFKLRRSRKN